MSIDEGERFTDGGYVVRADASFIELYSSRGNLPEEHQIFAYPEPEKSIRKTPKSYQQMIGKTISTAHELPVPSMPRDN